MNLLALRAAIAFAALPGIVAFLVPLAWLNRHPRHVTIDPLAIPVLVAGTWVLLWCVRDFYRHQGTLAPWDPPARLVVTGLYRYSRNPMYVGVSMILLGWAHAFHSARHLIYAVIVIALFHVRIVLGEEPRLARTHGEEWTRYSTRVRRWL